MNLKKFCFVFFILLILSACQKTQEYSGEPEILDNVAESTTSEVTQPDTMELVETTEAEETTTESINTEFQSTKPTVAETEENVDKTEIKQEKISFDSSWEFAEHSKIHSGHATLYRVNDLMAEKKNKVICINAGHGTKGGEDVKTLCHPDGSPKVTDGTTKKGETKAVAVASGTQLKNSQSEADANLSLAMLVKKELLKNGYDVLMIREKEDVQLDNIARTLIANNCADCHIALHYDGTAEDKGVFYCSVPKNKKYREMYPVNLFYEDHLKLGESVVSEIHNEGFSLYNNGKDAVDLTQTSFSTVPSIDLEVGDELSDTSKKIQKKLAKGIVSGLNQYFSQ